jgi:hypothetical protein
MYSYSLEHEDGIYRYVFVTRYEVKYAVYFAAADEYFGLTNLPPVLQDCGYTFGITRMTHEETCIPVDVAIKHTISAILADFYNILPESVLMINYEDHDAKEHKRVQQFERWFNELNTENRFIKEDTAIIIPDKVTYLSMIFPASHPQQEEVYEAFYLVKQDLVEGK